MFGLAGRREHPVFTATLPIDESFVTVEECMRAMFGSNRCYVDGRLEKRNVGEYAPGYVQTLLAVLFTNDRDVWRVLAVTDVRMQVNPTRFCVPDVSIPRNDALRERIITHPHSLRSKFVRQKTA